MGRFLRKQSCDWSICSWWRRGKEGREEGRGSCTSSRRSSRGRRRRRQEEKEEEEGCQVNGINLIDFFLYFSNPHTNTDANTAYRPHSSPPPPHLTALASATIILDLDSGEK